MESFYSVNSTEYSTDEVKSNSKGRNTKKVLLTLLILVLTIIIALIAVVAYNTQDFTINNSVTFISRDVKAQVIISATNAGNEIAIENNVFDIEASDPENVPHNAVIAPQTFIGTGKDNAIVYYFTITNRGTSPIVVQLNNIPPKNNLEISSQLYLQNDVENPRANPTIIVQDETVVVKISVGLKEPKETQVDLFLQVSLQLAAT